MGDLRQQAILAGWQWLLDQRHAGLGTGRHVFDEIAVAPGFVSIDDQAGIGGGAHGGDAGRIAVTAQFELEKRIMRCLPGGLAHSLGRAQAERVGGLHRFQCRVTAALGDADAAALGLQIPQRAIERVAGGTGRHCFFERLPVGRLAQNCLSDCRNDALRRLVIARIGRAFAASGMRPVGYFGNDDDHLRATAAGDGELTRDRPGFHRNGDGQAHAENCARM